MDKLQLSIFIIRKVVLYRKIASLVVRNLYELESFRPNLNYILRQRKKQKRKRTNRFKIRRARSDNQSKERRQGGDGKYFSC